MIILKNLGSNDKWVWKNDATVCLRPVWPVTYVFGHLMRYAFRSL